MVSVMNAVRQGCMLSLHLFNILLQAVMRETMDIQEDFGLEEEQSQT